LFVPSRCQLSGCYVATAEWLSSAVKNTAGKAQYKRSKRSCWHKPGRTDLWWKNIWIGVEPEDDVGRKLSNVEGLFCELSIGAKALHFTRPKSPYHRALCAEKKGGSCIVFFKRYRISEND